MSILSSDNVLSVANAMFGVLGKGGADILAYVNSESAKFAQSIETIVSLTKSGAISADEAKLQLDLQRNASQTVLSSVEGITAIVAARAINAGLSAIAGIVNTAIGFNILPTA